MTVTLNIENDIELRAYIKDAIKGQVLNIVREEFIQIVKDELERKVKGKSEDYFNRMLDSAAQRAISDILYKENGVNRYNDNFIKPVVEAKVNECIANKDWSRLIDDMAKQKVKALIG